MIRARNRNKYPTTIGRSPEKISGVFSVLKDKIKPLVASARPYTSVVESVAKVAVHMKNPSIIGIAALASTAVNTIDEILGERRTAQYFIRLPFPRELVLEELKNNGARLDYSKPESSSGNSYVVANFHGESLYFPPEGQSMYINEKDSKIMDWIREVTDKKLPKIGKIEKARRQFLKFDALEDPVIESKQANKITELTLPIIKDNNRAILLTGRPGVGKSTIARAIASKLNIGRIAIIESSILSIDKLRLQFGEESGIEGSALADTLYLLNPKVIIVDDLDKNNLTLEQMEILRNTAKLVIYTANNGTDDQVIDGASIRPGRIDEVFSIESEYEERIPPFDRLSDEDWEKIKAWPIAFKNEIKFRLGRNAPLDISDLENAVKKRTRSASVLI